MRVFSFSDWLSNAGSEGLKNFSLNQSYQRIAWVYSCVNITATTASSAALYFYEGPSQEASNRIVDPNHPVNQLFQTPKEPEIPSLRELLYKTFSYLGIAGQTFWVFSRKKGKLTTLEYRVNLKPILNDAPIPKLLGWQETTATGSIITYTVQQVLPILNFNAADPYSGMSPLLAARLSIETEFNIAGWNSSFFKSGMKNPLLLQAKGTLTKNQKLDIKKEISNYYSGIEGAHGALLLQGNIDATPLKVSPKDVDFVQGKKLNREEICFVPGTKIVTSLGLKSIEDINIGDLVLTHKNVYKPVKSVMSRKYDGELVKIRAKGLDEILVTPNHPFLISRFKRQHINNKYKLHPFRYPRWKEIDEVETRGRNKHGGYNKQSYDCLTMPLIPTKRTRNFIDIRDFVQEPVSTGEYSHTSNWVVETLNGEDYIRSNISTSNLVPCKIPLDTAFARLLGFFISEGSAGDFALQWHFGPTEQDYVDEVLQGMKDVFGLDGNSSIKETGLNVSVFNRIVRDLFNECGRGAANKKIPDWAFEAGKEFLDALLDAYICGDGSNNTSNGHAVTGITTRSETLAWQIRLLQWSKSVNTSLVKLDQFTTFIKGRKVSSNEEAYQVGWYDNASMYKHVHYYAEKANFFVKEKEYVSYEGSVFNLSVENDESYTTTGGVCHNCSIYGVPPALVGIFEYANYCLTADALIALEGGLCKRIIDLKPGDSVASMGEETVTFNKVLNCWAAGVKDIYQIKTSSRSLKCSPEHKYYSLLPGINPSKPRKTAWVDAKDLKIGDYVAISTKVPDTYKEITPEDKPATIELMHQLGLFVGDGSISSRNGYDMGIGIAIPETDIDKNSYIEEAGKVWKYARNFKDGRKIKVIRDKYNFRICSKDSVARIRTLGFAGTSKTKRLPDWVFGLKSDLKKSLLKGIFDSDGHYDKNGRVQVGLCNKELIEDIRNLCISVGYHVNNISEANRITNYGDQYICGIVVSFTDGQHSVKTFENHPLPEGLKWQKVRSISLLEQEETYDLEIEGTHNYIANWIVTHNSNVKEQRKIFWENTLLPRMEKISDLLQTNILNREFPGITCAWDTSQILGLKDDPKDLATAAKTYFEIGYDAQQVSVILNTPELDTSINRGSSKNDGLKPATTPTTTPATTPKPDEESNSLVSTNSKGFLKWAEAYSVLEGKEVKNSIGLVEDSIQEFVDKLTPFVNQGSVSKQVRWANLWEDTVGRELFKVGNAAILASVKVMKSVENQGRIKDIQNIKAYVPASTLRKLKTLINSQIKESRDIPIKVLDALEKGDSFVWNKLKASVDVLAASLVNTIREAVRYLAFQLLGVKSLIWISRGDCHTLMHGQRVDLGKEVFSIGADHPHQKGLPLSDIIRCNCTTVPLEFLQI